MSIIKKRLFIGGMTCVNCQNTIENTLKGTAGIQKVTVSYTMGVADIVYDSDMIVPKEIQTVIENLGYEVLSETKREKVDMGRIISYWLSLFLCMYYFNSLEF